MKMYVSVKTEYDYEVDVPSGNPQEAKDYVNENYQWLAPDSDNLTDAEVRVYDSDMNEIRE